MTADGFPARLEHLVQRGAIVPVIGGRGLRRSACEYADLLRAIDGFDCRAIISLSGGAPGREAAVMLDWHLKERTNLAYDLDRKVWIELGPDDSATDSEPFDHDYWSRLDRRQPYLWKCALAFAARDALLVLDCDPNNPVTQSVIGNLRQKVHFRSGGWIVWHIPLEPEVEWAWNELGFEVIVAELPATIGALRTLATGRALPLLDEALVGIADAGQSPYKLLHYYDVDDARFFFGRETEIERLVGMIAAHPLVVVTGASGAGKTSLLNAGVLSWFARHPPYQGFYVRLRDDPWRAFQMAIGGDDPGDSRERDIASIFASLVEGVRRREILPVVVFDQFEELFVRFSRLVQNHFWELIRSCLMSSEIPIRFVVVIRDDYLGQLAGMRNQYPAILQNSFFVPALSGARAHEAMVRPAARIGIRFDNALAKRIIGELEQRTMVSAPELQIVCDALFARHGGREIVAADYEALGGASQILASFMKGELAARGLEFQGSAAKVLKALVTSEETKENLPLARIATRAQLPLDFTMAVLATLRDDCRFVRSLAGDDEGFELSHDYLAREICSWMSAEEKEERLAHELLDREMRAWQHFGSIRLGPDRLGYFRERLNDDQLDDGALLYLLLSSVRHIEPAARWVEIVRVLDAERQRQISFRLFAFFEDADIASRREAAEVIALLDPSCVVESISAAKLSRRIAAIEMAGGLMLTAAVAPLLARLDDAGETDECRILACGALGELAAGNSDVVERLVKAASESANAAIADAATTALGSATSHIEALEVVGAALCSDAPDRRQAALAAAAQERTGAVFAHLVEHGLYERLDTPTRDALWDMALRLVEPEGGKMIDGIVKRLPREDLRRYDQEKWHGHWLYRRLIDEFCQRFPTECVSRKSNASAISLALTNFKYTSDGVRTIAKAGFIAELINHVRHKVPNEAMLGGLLRELISSSDLALRVTALRLAAGASSKSLDGVRRYLPASRVRTSLKAKDPTERYWACVATARLAYRDNAELLREMAADTGTGRPFDAKIGMEVKSAVDHALNALAPGSAVWRKGWQRSFETDEAP